MFILFFLPNQVFISKVDFLFLEISNVFVFLNPQFNSLRDSLLLKFFVSKPEATAITLLSFFQAQHAPAHRYHTARDQRPAPADPPALRRPRVLVFL